MTPQDQRIAEALGLPDLRDYARLQGLWEAVLKGDVLEEVDHEWLVALLETTSELLLRSKVMVLLAADQASPLSAQHRVRLDAVVARHINSANTLNRNSAAHLQAALDARNDGSAGTPP